ncbi:septal ring lytic transglycosylase RlpA family protein [Caballeronia ptereochthonis]|uniref:Endolytic peptidoglycan transglycosylase RlpA n=1 Tax=Caballeronia ptereochthonis TaxID=1777144 RepID=A0A158B6E5_9BURK|nr:septal ring lytic transglycosylase RlpA family protein [Caballeronia ptereochthonis]SAK65665.1 rare lipoprotein A [Caballeronia ptereochthonis]
MQDNGFITQWHAVGVVVIAASGACAADVHAQAAEDAGNAPDTASTAQSPGAYEGNSLSGEPFDYRDARTNETAEIGRASYYSAKFQGRRTASGEPYDMHALTAAHRTLPLGSYVRVSNLSKTKSVVVRINDRGPYTKGRAIDLSYAAASELGLLKAGSADVIVEPVGQRLAQASATTPPKRIMVRIAHHPRPHARLACRKAGHSRGRIQCGGARSSRA